MNRPARRGRGRGRGRSPQPEVEEFEMEDVDRFNLDRRSSMSVERIEQEISEARSQKIYDRFLYGLFGTIICIILAGSGWIMYNNHQRRLANTFVLDVSPLIDVQNALPFNIARVTLNKIDGDLQFDRNVTDKWKNVGAPRLRTDIPKMRQSQMAAQFWVVWSPCKFTKDKDAVALAMDQIDVVHRLVDKYPNDLVFATSADEITSTFEEYPKKIANLIGVRGGHMIDNRLSILRIFYSLGVRYFSLTDGCELIWMDSWINHYRTPYPNTHGLTMSGHKVVQELNRLGMIIDVSRTTRKVIETITEVSKAPVMLVHSAMYMEDQFIKDYNKVLNKIRKNDGIVLVGFHIENPKVKYADIFPKIIEHLEYLKKKIGIDHIGLASGFEAYDRFAAELNDASTYPFLFNHLKERGWSFGEMEKLAGENFLRVFRAVERVRDSYLVKGSKHYQVLPNEDLLASFDVLVEQSKMCQTDWFKTVPTQAMDWRIPHSHTLERNHTAEEL